MSNSVPRILNPTGSSIRVPFRTILDHPIRQQSQLEPPNLVSFLYGVFTPLNIKVCRKSNSLPQQSLTMMASPVNCDGPAQNPQPDWLQHPRSIPHHSRPSHKTAIPTLLFICRIYPAQHQSLPKVELFISTQFNHDGISCVSADFDVERGKYGI
jgi:hypothetical protein